MRISMRTGWLAAVALVLGIANGEVDIVVFNNESFGPGRIAVYLVDGVNPRPHNFTWTSQNVPVEEIKIYTYNPKVINSDREIGSKKATDPKLGQPLSGPDGSTLSLQPVVQIANGQEDPSDGRSRRRGPRQDTPASPTLSSTFTGFTVTSTNTSGFVAIDLLAFRNGVEEVYRGGHPLYLEAIWGNGQGRSYSRQFAVVRTVNGNEIELANEEPRFQNTTAYKAEERPDGMNSGNNGSSAPTSPNDGSIGSNPANDAVPGSGTGSGGLARGAIIGIAVAAGIIGLAAVLALVWFVVRRQKRKQQGLLPAGAYSPENHGDELIAEKEARSGVDATTTPQSPYSDDGNGAGTAAGTTASATTPTTYTQDPTQTFAPYTDRGSASLRQNDEAGGASAPSPVPGRATPRGLSTPYAHLVEEGMTEDDVRRLEEEERQLDAAIEQAGRR